MVNSISRNPPPGKKKYSLGVQLKAHVFPWELYGWIYHVKCREFGGTLWQGMFSLHHREVGLLNSDNRLGILESLLGVGTRVGNPVREWVDL